MRKVGKKLFLGGLVWFGLVCWLDVFVVEVGGLLWGGVGWDGEREGGRERETRSSELWYSVVCLYVCMYVHVQVYVL